jgi:hypothetical protein
MTDFALPVIVREVFSPETWLTIQYAVAYQPTRDASEYWMPRLHEA